ncbi:MAG: hypothetical protein RIM72_03445 [Alphaproteobacteria bacterium]
MEKLGYRKDSVLLFDLERPLENKLREKLEAIAEILAEHGSRSSRALLDQIIQYLDSIDGDSDLEEGHELEDCGDFEPSLGWTLDGDLGDRCDLERQDEDFEPEEEDKELSRLESHRWLNPAERHYLANLRKPESPMPRSVSAYRDPHGRPGKWITLNHDEV